MLHSADGMASDLGSGPTEDPRVRKRTTGQGPRDRAQRAIARVTAASSSAWALGRAAPSRRRPISRREWKRRTCVSTERSGSGVHTSTPAGSSLPEGVADRGDERALLLLVGGDEAPPERGGRAERLEEPGRDRQRADQHRVHDREHHGGAPDPDRERGRCGQGERPLLHSPGTGDSERVERTTRSECNIQDLTPATSRSSPGCSSHPR